MQHQDIFSNCKGWLRYKAHWFTLQALFWCLKSSLKGWYFLLVRVLQRSRTNKIYRFTIGNGSNGYGGCKVPPSYKLENQESEGYNLDLVWSSESQQLPCLRAGYNRCFSSRRKLIDLFIAFILIWAFNELDNATYHVCWWVWICFTQFITESSANLLWHALTDIHGNNVLPGIWVFLNLIKLTHKWTITVLLGEYDLGILWVLIL